MITHCMLCLKQNIGQLLLTYGRMQIAELVKRSKIPMEQVQRCLIILLVHNCLRWVEEYADRIKEDLRVYSHGYEVHLENVLMRLRYAKFINYIKEAHGKEVQHH